MMRIALASLVLLLAFSAQGAHYVSDLLVITLRSGPGTQFQVLDNLKSGAALELLGEESDGWIKVKTPAEVEGWVLSRFVTDRPIHRVRLEAANRRVERLSEENGELKASVAALEQRGGELDSELAQMSSRAESLSGELDQVRKTAARPLELEAANRDLRAELTRMETETDLLRSENDRLRDRTRLDWFIAGGGVLVVGIVLGLVLPRARRRRSMFE